MVPLHAKPGTTLVCVDVALRPQTKKLPLVFGASYTLRGWLLSIADNEPQVLLEEVRVLTPYPWFASSPAVESGFLRERFCVVEELKQSERLKASKDVERWLENV